MNTKWCFGFSLWLIIGCSSQNPNAASHLEALIMNDATGEPLAARVAVTNSEGKFVEIEGRHPHVQYLDKRWCYVTGRFSLASPDSGAGIEIRHGLETRPVSVTFAGDGVEFQGPNRLEVRKTARSILPFATLEIVLNGETAGHKTVPLEQPAGGRRLFDEG